MISRMQAPNSMRNSATFPKCGRFRPYEILNLPKSKLIKYKANRTKQAISGILSPLIVIWLLFGAFMGPYLRVNSRSKPPIRSVVIDFFNMMITY